LRKSKNLTQEQLAGIFGIKRENISRWENGVAEPSRENLLKIADYFNVSTDYLLGRDSPTNAETAREHHNIGVNGCGRKTRTKK
jgi:transcriptional regulator with XRE-family HTH domain